MTDRFEHGPRLVHWIALALFVGVLLGLMARGAG